MRRALSQVFPALTSEGLVLPTSVKVLWFFPKVIAWAKQSWVMADAVFLSVPSAASVMLQQSVCPPVSTIRAAPVRGSEGPGAHLPGKPGLC